MADVDSREPEQQEQKDAEAVPFFARFLEDQKRVRTGVKAGKPATTLKYPSDREDGGGGGEPPIYTTLKYPSDGDEV
ncbi:MAG TPA: microviridin/marinostatin family tricyclic proteinase inhibitor [Sorangium sp.]|uniref:microviridin/marinostatin family tricyclic proteinase inhibitor n=1 Tax=unclassified Sorangium TaxID=2621164 RepID=UPI002C430437|nr:microviridin/marinostatin family tricyclic proteinase inhibitor [Sorangium sp.]